MSQQEPKISSLEDYIGIAIRDIDLPPRPSVLTDIEAGMLQDESDFS